MEKSSEYILERNLSINWCSNAADPYFIYNPQLRAPGLHYTYDFTIQGMQTDTVSTPDISPNLATIYHSLPLKSNHHLPWFHRTPLAVELQDEHCEKVVLKIDYSVIRMAQVWSRLQPCGLWVLEYESDPPACLPTNCTFVLFTNSINGRQPIDIRGCTHLLIL